MFYDVTLGFFNIIWVEKGVCKCVIKNVSRTEFGSRQRATNPQSRGLSYWEYIHALLCLKITQQCSLIC